MCIVNILSETKLLPVDKGAAFIVNRSFAAEQDEAREENGKRFLFAFRSKQDEAREENSERLSFAFRSKQDEEGAQTTTGAYTDVRDQGVRKPDKVLRRL